ncbi:MAG: GDSL-type esterase/lipase family protein [Candidatus Dormibacteria bacterium]
MAALLLTGCGGGADRPPAPSLSPTSQRPPAAATPEPGAPMSPFPGDALAGTNGVTVVAGAPPVDGTPWFLTIGDSITAGYSRDPDRRGTNSGWPVQLEGTLARSGRAWRLFDVACSGETTTTYRGRCPQRAAIPFLQSSSQRDVAMAAISAHLADLRLIVVDLGSNDLLLAALAATPVTAVAPELQDRLESIVSELRRVAPRVPLVLANYYDPFQNSSPTTLGDVMRVNAAVADVARRHGATVADFFAAINTPAGISPDLCVNLDCQHLDPIHPTVAGHARLAAAAAAAVPAP